MEIQSGNGEALATGGSATLGSISQSLPGSQVDRDPAHGADLQAGKRIERFDIPLDSLKRIFEKPIETNPVSSATMYVPCF